jgi:hypothetical protein
VVSRARVGWAAAMPPQAGVGFERGGSEGFELAEQFVQPR